MTHGGTQTHIAEIDLTVTGMTCASCASHVEKGLNKLESVTAEVNLATETAHVRFDPATVEPTDLVAAVEATGYGAHLPESQHDAHQHDEISAADLRLRMIVGAVLTIPLLIFGMISSTQFDGWRWVSLVLAAPVVLWAGLPFHRATITNLAHRATTMDTLVSLGTLAALTWSTAALFVDDAEVYFEVASVVIVFLVTGRYLEAKAKRRSGAALRALLDLGAKDVAVMRDSTEVRVPIDELRAGDEFVVRPGEKVATDGTVLDGTSAVDESLLTGEAVPVEVGRGSSVTGGTVNVSGLLHVRATRVGRETRLAQIAALVVAAQSGKAPVQRLADRISAVFVPVVLVIATATALGWWAAGGSATEAFTAAIAVLIVACPCALGLATPTALLVGTGRGAQLGVLIRGPQVLESTRRIDTIVLDKTGTVTTGDMTVHGTHAVTGEDVAQVLRLAGAVEHGSHHPIAAAVTRTALAGGPLPTVTAVRSAAGRGVSGDVLDFPHTNSALVGTSAFLAAEGIAVDDGSREFAAQAQAAGRTPIFVAWNGQLRGVIVVGDAVRESSPAAVSALHSLGLRPVLLTGDNAGAAAVVATAVGIDKRDVRAQVAPEDKAAAIAELQRSGHVVAMVGDGVNDAAALAQADLGLAMGSGSDAAIEAADLTLVRTDLSAAVDAIRLSRRTLGTIKANLFWAFAYNVVLIPVAAAGLLNPMLAGLAMALSSLFVVTNSLRLRRFKPVSLAGG